MSKELKAFPNIFEYENYRLFLKDAYESLKAKDSKFSYRYFARIAGFNSHNFLSLIIDGKSNVSPESAEKIAKAFKLNTPETRFFQNLVLMNQAKTSEEKLAHHKEILRARTYRRIHDFNQSKYEFFSHWYISAVREMVALPGFDEDPEWIASHAVPPIKPAEARKAIDELLKLGLIKRNEDGKLTQSEALLTTPAEVSSAYVANWHKEHLKKAAESIDLIPRDKRDISAVSFGFTKKNIKVLKEMISNFRKGVVHLASEQDDKDVLFHLSIQLFPLAETKGDESE